MEGSISNPNNAESRVVLSPDPISFIPAPGSFCRLLLPKSMRDDLDRQFGYGTNAQAQYANFVVPQTRDHVPVRIPFVPALHRDKDKEKIRDINLNVAWTEGDDDVSKGQAKAGEELDLELRL